MLNKKVISIGGSAGVALTTIMLVMALGTTTEMTNEISTDGMPKALAGGFPPATSFNENAGDKVPEFVQMKVPGTEGLTENRANLEYAKYNSLKSTIVDYKTLEVYTDESTGDQDIILGKKSVKADPTTYDILYSQDYIWITKNPHTEKVSTDVYKTIPLNKGYKLIEINDVVKYAPVREMTHLVDFDDKTIGIAPLDIWFVTDEYSYTIRGHISETQAIELANRILSLEE